MESEHKCPKCGGPIKINGTAAMFKFRCDDCGYGASNAALLTSAPGTDEERARAKKAQRLTTGRGSS